MCSISSIFGCFMYLIYTFIEFTVKLQFYLSQLQRIINVQIIEFHNYQLKYSIQQKRNNYTKQTQSIPTKPQIPPHFQEEDSIFFIKLSKTINILNIEQSMILLRSLFQRFSQQPLKKYWSEANNIFKDYYSRRLSLSPNQLEKYLIKVSMKEFNEADHRWISLIQSIEQNFNKYKPNSKVFMLKALSTMGSKSQLLTKLINDSLLNLKELNFQQTAILLWSLSRQNNKRVEDVTKVIKQINSILKAYENEGETKIVITKEEDHQKFQQKVLGLKSSSVCMVLSSMASLQITEKFVVKTLLKNGIRPNLSAFALNGLISLLISFEKLGIRNKKDSLFVYKQIRSRYKQIQLGPIESISNLVITLSNLTYSKHFEEIQHNGQAKTPQSIQNLRQILKDLRKFLLWLAQTIILREQKLSKETASKMLHYCAKAKTYDQYIWNRLLLAVLKNIQDCKIIDLVMSLKAIVILPPSQRQRHKEPQELISKRLWALYQSISGTSLQILASLLKNKLIDPPPKLTQILTNINQKPKSEKQPEQAFQEKAQ